MKNNKLAVCFAIIVCTVAFLYIKFRALSEKAKKGNHPCDGFFFFWLNYPFVLTERAELLYNKVKKSEEALNYDYY